MIDVDVSGYPRPSKDCMYSALTLLKRPVAATAGALYPDQRGLLIDGATALVPLIAYIPPTRPIPYLPAYDGHVVGSTVKLSTF